MSFYRLQGLIWKIIVLMSKLSNMDTQQKIKQVTKTLIFGKGKFDFRLSEIAKEADVSHSILHYYFRTRKQLLLVIEDEMITEFMTKGKSWLTNDLPVREKVELYISSSFQRLSQYPFTDLYLFSRFNTETEMYAKDFRIVISKFSLEIRQAMNLRIIKNYEDPIHFIMNMISMTAYPFVLIDFFEKASIIDIVEKNNLIEKQKELIIKKLFD